MTRRRWPLGILFSVGLLGLVGMLAWLQYRWLGEVSEAEHARLQASLKQRAAEFADDFDREITRAYLTFQIDGAALATDPAAIATRYDRWQKDARAALLVRSVYLAQSSAPDELQEYQPALRTLVRVAWPGELDTVRQRLQKSGTAIDVGAGTTLRLLRDPIVSSIPALVLPVPAVEAIAGAPVRTFITGQSQSTVIVVFDREYLEKTFLPSLVKRYFPEDGTDTYRFAVIDPADPAHALFSRGVAEGSTLRMQQADATTPLFAFRFNLLEPTMTAAPRGAILSGGAVSITTHEPGQLLPTPKVNGGNQQYSIFVEQRATSTSPRSGGAAGGTFTRQVTGFSSPNLRMLAPGAWQLVLQHPAGSLEAAVGQARQRNLTLSFGILALLCVSVALIVVNAHRSQRLAGQQMDFVATVSHELRTPLAVIRSAAQNLSAGVVHEPAQAKRYGELIETEGRRLTDMIEQVLDYSGLSGQRRPRGLSAVDVAVVVRDVTGSCRSLFEADRMEVSMDIERDLPPVMADEGALRRALQNLVTNAVKYGAAGRWIGIEAKRAAHKGVDEVHLTVSDRGPGVDAADLGHIFEPFYRGAPARDRQIHGNGLGLSLVKRIAEAHEGRVMVKSAVGQGASFTIALPASAGVPDPGDAETGTLVPHAPTRS